jgi:ABC-type uncharacterized transport system substrate-binding protein
MRNKYIFLIFIFTLLFFPAQSMAQQRILYIDSYHEGYEWSDGVTEGIQSVLRGEDVLLKIHRMDTKRNGSEAFKKNAGLAAKSVIEDFNPHIVIASDDNASKYLIKPYYKDSSLPFVFCGVNHSGKAYGYPYKNVTGMVEVSPIAKLIYSLKHFRRTEKVALLIGDSLTDHKDAESYAEVINLRFDQFYVKDFEEWKNQYVQIQNSYDILLIGNNASVAGWNSNEAISLVMSQTKIPTGCDLDFMTPFAFLGYTKVAQEQGRWAAETALKILISGTPVSQIPIAKNKDGNLIVNLKVAKAAGIKVPKSFLRKAVRVIE